MNRMFLIVVWLAASGAGAQDQDLQFHLSPPAVSPTQKEPGVIDTDLRNLQDAYGLALLVEDDTAAERIARIVKKWEKSYAPLLGSDPVLKEIDTKMGSTFGQMLGDRRRPVGQLKKLIAKAPKERIRPILIKWLKSLLHRRKVFFPEDLERLSKADLTDICMQARALDTQKGLPSWRYRFLAWLYRDREVQRMFADRDDRMVFLTPVRIQVNRKDAAGGNAIRRYLAMVRNLKLQVLKNRSMPYDQYRTMEGLVRGLRYMDTIRQASALTGLDHRLMTRLFIQESEFIHQRVSWAGAFSLAQFLNIALKDIWLFKGRIPGAGPLLKGIKSFEDLKKKVVADPRMAIKASCVYFRRLRDEVVLRLGKKGRSASQEMLTLMTLELYALHKGTGERSALDSLAEIGRVWPVREMMMLPLVPITGGMLPDAGAMLAGWMEHTAREMVALRLSQSVFEQRLERLYSALGLAAYNAGMSNLIKASKRKSPFGPLSFPLQITENRNYVDDILDGKDILEDVGKLVSGISLMEYDDVMKVTEQACQKAGIKSKK